MFSQISRSDQYETNNEFQMLQVMGLTNGVFWMAWFIDSFIMMTFSSAVLTFILTVNTYTLRDWLHDLFTDAKMVDRQKHLILTIQYSITVRKPAYFCWPSSYICVFGVVHNLCYFLVVLLFNHLQVKRKP